MDLGQTKLTKNEWDALEVSVPAEEKTILKLIYNGYDNLDYIFNYTISLMSFIKISHDTDKFHGYFYIKYFQPLFMKINEKYKLSYDLKKFPKLSKKLKLKKADEIRIKNSEKKLEVVKDELFEFVLIDLLKNMFKYRKKSSYYYFTLIQIMKNNIHLFNPYVKEQIEHILQHENNSIKKTYFIKKAYDYIEKNPYLLKFANYNLYDHQKKLFWLCKKNTPKLINYIAPTGTGKTLSPIGLTKGNRVIFTCAAKHVGMQLAKCCISLKIPIAIAFGCVDPGDIRLHYFAAKDYVRHRKTGAIFRVDNSVGDKVEIIICDIQSYESAMNYMLAFNEPENIIWYWDEPTITMDYPEHEFHAIMKRNWHKNIIPNVILSSATLPKHDEINPCLTNFLSRFPTAEINEICSYDCKKTIPIYDMKGRVVLPHYMFSDFTQVKISLKHLEENKTILRHFDLREICKFIIYVNEKKLITDRYLIPNYFEEIADIDVMSIKLYYLKLLKNLKKNYDQVYNYFQEKWVPTYDSMIKISTADSWTLTDGPTIFLADDIKKIAFIFLKSANIPADIIDKLLSTIYKNIDLRNRLEELTKSEEDRKLNMGKSSKFYDRADITGNTAESQALREFERAVTEIKDQMLKMELDAEYIPNSYAHLKKWKLNLPKDIKPFTSDIDEETVEKIMLLDVDNIWKILLMMGIGVFIEHNCVDFSEIMKKLATDQKLYLILASTDYIYGTNYQFCHGYLSKDLMNITQEKMIQAFGRVGRSNAQRNYSLRVRSDELITKLLMPADVKPEIANMNKLFGEEE
jgi:hypothetical protein